jgi:hypothetical protein
MGMPNCFITLERISTETASLRITADNENDAREQVEKMVKEDEINWELQAVEHEITGIEED